MDSAVATTTGVEMSPPQDERERALRARDGDKPRQPPVAASTAGQAPGRSSARPTGRYRHVAAVHYKTRPSTLSHDSDATPSFLGFRNLMVIFLVVGNLRLMIENVQKYGNLICLTCHDFRRQDVLLGTGLYFLVPGFLFVAHLIEQYAAQTARISRAQEEEWQGRNEPSSPTEAQQVRFYYTWRVIRALHGLNATATLLVTSWVVFHHIHHPLIGTVTELHSIIVWMKMASYALTNRDLRHAYLHPARGELAALPEIYEHCPYPQNVTMANLAYFWWAPTLVYQPVYPRTERVRWTYVGKRLGEALCLSVFIWFCSAQYAAPTLRNSLDSMAELNVLGITERLLKLSTISLVIWLAGFFALFQSMLNGLAEVMRFGDRAFYDDWWNSASLGDYWRMWNKPVNQFMRRHVYSPLVARGYSIWHASIAVFFVSAILHEFLVGIPTHNIIGVAFMGMLLQLPLIKLTAPMQKWHSPTWRLVGNCIFWVTFTVFGQPFAALIYFYAWQSKYGSVSRKMAGPA